LAVLTIRREFDYFFDEDAIPIIGKPAAWNPDKLLLPTGEAEGGFL
jgi:hypothetical protein